MSDAVFISFSVGFLVLILITIFWRIDGLVDKMDTLEYKINKTVSEIDLCTKKFPYASTHKTRLDRLESSINFITHRLNNLPSEKAKVIQQKVDELEEMVKELK